MWIAEQSLGRGRHISLIGWSLECYTLADFNDGVEMNPEGYPMITKERLEETIRGVIREFKRTKRITDPAADELTAALEECVDELFDQEATYSYREVEDSAQHIAQLRDNAQLESTETFLREIVAWQQMHSS